MNGTLSAAELIAQKYWADGADVIHAYQGLRFDKHIRLMRAYMNFRPGMRVLDVGCGTGAMLVELVNAGARVTGIDTFEEAGGIDRRIAQARLRESHVEAKIVNATAADLPFADNQFDLAVNIGMLEHIPPNQRQQVLQEIFRVIRPGGFMFLIAGPTQATPYDQHIPGCVFSNWLSRQRKLEISRKNRRRQLLEVPWGVSRRELRDALPDATVRSLYSAYFRMDGGQPLRAFRPSLLWLLACAKRRLHLHCVFGVIAGVLYLVRQEHCHIVAIQKNDLCSPTQAVFKC